MLWCCVVKRRTQRNTTQHIENRCVFSSLLSLAKFIELMDLPIVSCLWGIPTPLSQYMHFFPKWLLRLSTVSTYIFLIGIFTPFMSWFDMIAVFRIRLTCTFALPHDEHHGILFAKLSPASHPQHGELQLVQLAHNGTRDFPVRWWSLGMAQ